MSEFELVQPVAQVSEPTCVPIAAGQHLESSSRSRATRRMAGASPPLSFAQQQVWLHAQLAPDVPLYNEVLILQRTGALNRVVLERSLNEIVRRHESLRTTFPAVEGTPVQMIAECQAVELLLTDLSGLPDERGAAEALRISTEEARRRFDVAEGPLLRGRLLRLSPENHILVLTLHTLIADAWSLNVLARELDALYRAYSAGGPSPLSDLPVQYADNAHGQRSGCRDDVLERQISYWRERLTGIPAVLELPADRPRPPVQAFHGARHCLLCSNKLSEALKELSQREGAPLFATLLAAFQTLLSRYTGQDDIVVGSILPGRDGAGSEDLIGLFAHTMITRTNLAGDPSFRELLRRVRNAARSDCDHQSVPFDRVVNELQPERDPSRNPLFQVLFSLTNSFSFVQSDWKVANFEVDTGAAKVDLELQLCDRPEGLLARFTYNSDLFDAATISRMAEHFTILLQGIVANPDQRLSSLPLLTPAERHRLLVEWNDTQAEFPRDRCVHQLFEAQAARTPNVTAVVFENEQLTYGELNRRANQLAHHLRKLNVGPEVLVTICAERSLDMIVGLLGILKAGGAYVPLDPTYPHERLSFMVEDAEVPVLLTQSRVVQRLPQSNATVVCLDTDWPTIAKESDEDPASETKPENLAYVIYTSGSTGKPKGVQIPHRAVVNFLTSMSRKPGMTSADRLLAVTTLSFDIAGLEIYLPLILGASVEIVSREVASDGSQLLSKLTSAGATVLQATPATWRMLLEAGWEGSPRLKALCGGEAVSRKLANQLRGKTGALWNVYGPTETTIWSTTTQLELAEGPVPIGQPIANTQIFILDKALQPVPIGVAGELHIGGDGLARGYLKRPQLTAEKFIPNPLSPVPGARLYKTGDLVRYLPNGDIEFLGRIDHQTKIRGFRVELGEIEAAVRQHPAINETVVVLREDNPGDQRLVAYVVPAPGSAPTVEQLRDFLRGKLPEYMVPSAFVMLNAMPLTPNGKVNRRALPSPDQSALARKEVCKAPSDAIESQLVRIWESVLGVRPIGVRHNFFELGGHSLLAVRMMQRAERVFGKALPIATLFQAPTIEQLAGIVRQKGWSPRWSYLVAIQAGGSKPPLFCVHGAGGAVVRFYDLARYLGPDQPVYGLQARGSAGNHSPHRRVEDMAAAYLKEILSVQPQGPYFLAGYSFGGVVALDIAHQLIAQGQVPPLVVLFDTFCPTFTDGTLAEKFSALLKVLRVPITGTWADVSRKAKAVKRGVQRRLSHMRVPRALKQVRRACEEAAGEYVLRVYPGRMVLFRSHEKPLTQFRDPHAAWNAYAGQGLEIHEILGDHDDILLEPQVRSVAEQLKECLDGSRAVKSSGHSRTDHLRCPPEGARRVQDRDYSA
jgi:surfactin family lipopeptide synthetase A